MKPRAAFVSLALGFSLLAPLPAHAAWPEKPIRFIVPSAAGGSPDVLMRVMTNELSSETPKWAGVIRRANVKVD